MQNVINGAIFDPASSAEFDCLTGTAHSPKSIILSDTAVVVLT
jgi:hypothetical protein